MDWLRLCQRKLKASQGDEFRRTIPAAVDRAAAGAHGPVERRDNGIRGAERAAPKKKQRWPETYRGGSGGVPPPSVASGTAAGVGGQVERRLDEGGGRRLARERAAARVVAAAARRDYSECGTSKEPEVTPADAPPCALGKAGVGKGKPAVPELIHPGSPPVRMSDDAGISWREQPPPAGRPSSSVSAVDGATISARRGRRHESGSHVFPTEREGPIPDHEGEMTPPSEGEDPAVAVPGSTSESTQEAQSGGGRGSPGDTATTPVIATATLVPPEWPTRDASTEEVVMAEPFRLDCGTLIRDRRVEAFLLTVAVVIVVLVAVTSTEKIGPVPPPSPSPTTTLPTKILEQTPSPISPSPSLPSPKTQLKAQPSNMMSVSPSAIPSVLLSASLEPSQSEPAVVVMDVSQNFLVRIGQVFNQSEKRTFQEIMAGYTRHFGSDSKIDPNRVRTSCNVTGQKSWAHSLDDPQSRQLGASPQRTLQSHLWVVKTNYTMTWESNYFPVDSFPMNFLAFVQNNRDRVASEMQGHGLPVIYADDAVIPLSETYPEDSALVDSEARTDLSVAFSQGRPLGQSSLTLRPSPSPTFFTTPGYGAPPLPRTASPTVSAVPTLFPLPREVHEYLPAVLPVSTTAALEDPTSPQRRALEWLVRERGKWAQPDQEKRVQQRFALATFYFATGGNASWERQFKFLDHDQDECDWQDVDASGVVKGVVGCTRKGVVTNLFLAENNLTGTLPMEIAALTKLETLSLAANRLTGSIPDAITQIRTLKDMRMFDNDFTGALPRSFGNLANLAFVALFQNEISGPIPSSIGNCTELVDILLGKNSFSGALPSMMGKLNLVENLYLEDNLLSGQVPQELRNMASLDNLWLSI